MSVARCWLLPIYCISKIMKNWLLFNCGNINSASLQLATLTKRISEINIVDS